MAEMVEVAGLEIAFERAGDGPPLVLLHGILADSRSWRPQLAALSDDFELIAWDAPGAGRSSDPAAPFGMADWADCLAAFLGAVGVDRAHVLGLSWGGVLALELYRRSPGMVTSLILADTYAGWRGSLPEQVCDDRLAGCLREAAQPPGEFVPRWLPGLVTDGAPAAVRQELGAIMGDFHPDGYRLMATAVAECDQRDLLPRIEAPTLLIWGDDDRRSPLSIAHQLRNAIADATIAVIPAAGHVSNLEQPGRFNDEVRRFLLGQA